MLGAQSYRAHEISHEWGLANRTLLAAHAGNLTAMLTDTAAWAWLPETLPDGSYAGKPESVVPYLVNYSAMFLVLLLLCVVGCCGGGILFLRAKARGGQKALGPGGGGGGFAKEVVPGGS